MKGEWSFWSEYFTPQVCDKIITLAMKLPPKQPTVGGATNLAEVQKMRKSTVRWIMQDNKEFDFLFDDYWKLAVRMNRDFFGFNITTLPHIQFTEYHAENNDEYKSHQDVFWITDTPNHRKMTLITQLTPSENYDGGNLTLDNVAVKIPEDKIKTQGTVIAFPSFVYHTLHPVTRGTRYSIVGWFEGPKFQ